MKVLHLLLIQFIFALTFHYVSLSPTGKLKAFFGISAEDLEHEDYIKNVTIELCPLNLNKRRDYKIIHMLGKGGFGVVYKAMHKKFNTVALKVISKKMFISNRRNHASAILTINAEIKALKTLNSSEPPIAPRFYEAFQDTKYFYVAMDILEGITLHSIMLEYSAPITYLKEMEARNLTALLISMIFQMQNKFKLLHLDLNGNNIFLDNAGHIRFIDFGSSHFIEDTNYKVYCADQVRPPFANQTEHSEFDFWAVAIHIAEYLIGTAVKEILYSQPDYYKQLEKELLNNGLSAVGASFLSGMSNFNVDERLGYKNKDAIRNHSWFQDFIYNETQFSAINVDTAFLNKFFFYNNPTCREILI